MPSLLPEPGSMPRRYRLASTCSRLRGAAKFLRGLNANPPDQWIIIVPTTQMFQGIILDDSGRLLDRIVLQIQVPST